MVLGNRIGDEGSQAIADALKINSTITEIVLTNRSKFSSIIEDIRKMILQEICKVWQRTSRIDKNIKEIESMMKIIWERKMKNIEEKEFKLIEKKHAKFVISIKLEEKFK